MDGRRIDRYTISSPCEPSAQVSLKYEIVVIVVMLLCILILCTFFVLPSAKMPNVHLFGQSIFQKIVKNKTLIAHMGALYGSNIEFPI